MRSKSKSGRLFKKDAIKKARKRRKRNEQIRKGNKNAPNL